MLVATNTKVVNKSQDWESLAKDFTNENLSQKELAEIINQGHAFTTQHRERRQAENFQAAGYIGLDFDHTTPEEMDQILANPLVQKYHSIFYYTASSKPETPKFRLVFELEYPIYSADYYRKVVQAFVHHFSASDKSCKDVCRFFYGHEGSNPRVTGNRLPMEIVEQVTQEHARFLEEQDRARFANNSVQNRSGGGVRPGVRNYLLSILETQCDNVRRALEGTRHNTLRDAARTMGGYLQGEPGALDEAEVRRALEEAYSVHPNLNRREMLKTIDAGISYGRRHPLYVPDLPAPGLEPVRMTEQERVQEQEEPRVDQETGEVRGDTDDYLVQFSADDEGNAQSFMELYGKDFLYCHSLDWLFWTGTYWKRDLAEAQLRTRIKDTLRRRQIAASAVGHQEAVWRASRPNAGVVASCLMMIRPKVNAYIEEFDRDPWLFNVRNGTLDLRTGELRPHNPADRLLKMAGTSYDPQAKAPTWENLVKWAMVDRAELVEYLQMWLGYCLTGDVSAQVFNFWFGEGDNGKSTITQTLLGVWGDYGMKLPKDTLMALRPGQNKIPTDIADLKGIRLAVSTETQKGQHMDESLIKDLTGGDSLRARHMHRDYFGFEPTHKFIQFGNHKPVVKDQSEGLWRRLHLVPFENKVTAQAKDPHLVNKLQAEFPGILAWLVRGCLKWQETGYRLGKPEAISKATSAYRTEQDPLGPYLLERCLFGAQYRVTVADLYRDYEEWCQSNGERHPFGKREITERLNREGVVSKPGNSNKQTYFGVGLLAEPERELKVTFNSVGGRN